MNTIQFQYCTLWGFSQIYPPNSLILSSAISNTLLHHPLSHCVCRNFIWEIVLFVSKNISGSFLNQLVFCFPISYFYLVDHIAFSISSNMVYVLILKPFEIILSHTRLFHQVHVQFLGALDFPPCIVIFPRDSSPTGVIFCRTTTCVQIVKVSFSPSLQRPRRVHWLIVSQFRTLMWFKV